MKTFTLPLAVLALALGPTLAPAAAHAFCGFYVSGADGAVYNEATKVVLMRQGRRTVLSMQNAYQGPPEDFAMVVPVPVVLQETDVKTLPRTSFDRIDALSAPRLVEYWEQDPCYRPPRRRLRRSRATVSGARPSPAPASARPRHGVVVEAEFAVGEYDIQILSAQDSSGLDTWLHEENYNIPAGAGEVLRPYVEQGTKFFVAKVNVSRVTFEGGRAVLSPLRFHYDADEFSLPVRLGLLNSNGTQDLIVHILAPNQRYEVANYPNAFIPTNLRVRNVVRNNFGRFYTALFDKTLRQNRGAVITEYSWQATSCDPCPTQPLSQTELTLFGLDVIAGTPANPGVRGDLGTRGGPDARSAQRGRRRPPRPPGPRWGGGSQMVLTRLHYRYDRESLGADLVFRPADAVIGGRGMPNRGGRLEEQRQPSSSNQFQGRYVMLNWWPGAIACENPRRGIWGGPPDGRQPQPSTATDTAYIRRRRAPLERWIRDDVPEINLRHRSGGSGATPAPKSSGPSTGGAPPSAPPVRPAPLPAGDGAGAMNLGSLGAGGAGILGSFFGLFLWRRRTPR